MFHTRIACLALAAFLPLAAVAQTITVSAAASLTQAFKELAQRFEVASPGATVRLNFGASGALYQQISQGAPADVFASADQATMDRAAKAALIVDASRVDFASNSLVLVGPSQGAVAIGSLQDLDKPEVKRIAVGKPATVPAGRYARQALEKAGLWETLKPRFVQADSVRQVLDYVGRGEVEAGFVYATDAAVMKDRVKVVAAVSGHDPITYPVAVVAGSSQEALAGRFVSFLSGEPAREILARHGFGIP
jgi:molybdate transport system substrate-binding protein